MDITVAQNILVNYDVDDDINKDEDGANCDDEYLFPKTIFPTDDTTDPLITAVENILIKNDIDDDKNKDEDGATCDNTYIFPKTNFTTDNTGRGHRSLGCQGGES